MSIDTEHSPLPIEMLAKWAKEKPEKVYLRQPVNGDYYEYTWPQVYDQVMRLAAGYAELGLQPGDKVVILSENCAEWFIADFAIQAAGLVSVPIYFTAGEETISFVIEHSEAKAVIVGKLADYAAAEKAVPTSLITIAMPYQTVSCQYQMRDLIERNEPKSAPSLADKDDVFSISYTSGSTGTPKGVVLTYRNIIYGGLATVSLMEHDVEPRVLSYLPLAHITERALIEYASLYACAEVTFNDNLQTFLDDLRKARVTFFISVPRLWIKFQAGVLGSLPQKKLDLLLKIPFVSGRVKKKIKQQLGLDHVLSCGCGSAPVPPAILQWYDKLGIEISEGWGMTECSGMGISQFPYRADKVGTIGRPLEGLEVKLSDQGEILLKGDAVFREYYKNPEATGETFTEDGFMRTGDRGEVDSEGYYRITGRVKDQFKSAKGKYVTPVPIEGKLGVNQLIDQSCVMGSGLAKPIAVVVLAAEVANGMSPEEISQSLKSTMDEVNSTLEKHEILGGVRIAADPWTVENGLLTPTLKIKRTELEQKYRSFIAEANSEPVVWENS